MRVTLKVEYKQQAIRHNLDLYNNESLDKLVRRCAERFALGTAYLAAAFATLMNVPAGSTEVTGERKRTVKATF